MVKQELFWNWNDDAFGFLLFQIDMLLLLLFIIIIIIIMIIITAYIMNLFFNISNYILFLVAIIIFVNVIFFS